MSDGGGSGDRRGFFDDSHFLDPSYHFVTNLEALVHGVPLTFETHRTNEAWRRAMLPRKEKFVETMLAITRRSGIETSTEFMTTKLFNPHMRYLQVLRHGRTKEVFGFITFVKDPEVSPISGHYSGYRYFKARIPAKLPMVPPVSFPGFLEQTVTRDLLAEAASAAPSGAEPCFYLAQWTHNPVAMGRYAYFYPTYPNFHLVQQRFDIELQEVVGDVCALLRKNGSMYGKFASLARAELRTFLRRLAAGGFVKGFDGKASASWDDEQLLSHIERNLYSLSFFMRTTRQLDTPEYGGPHPNAPKCSVEDSRRARESAEHVGHFALFQELNERFRRVYYNSIPPLMLKIFERRARSTLGDLVNDTEVFDPDYFVMRNRSVIYMKNPRKLEDRTVPIINDVVHGLCDYKRNDKLIFGSIVTAATLHRPMTNLVTTPPPSRL